MILQGTCTTLARKNLCIYIFIGLVEPDFYNEHGASNFLKEIRDEMRRLTELDTKEKHVRYER